jgi:biopolymer transport protein TolR
MNRHKNQRLLSQMNVVPYVDVMLVLLVIFMITTPLLSQGIVIDLPNVAADPLDAASSDPLVLSVDPAGRFYLNFGGAVVSTQMPAHKRRASPEALPGEARI